MLAGKDRLADGLLDFPKATTRNVRGTDPRAMAWDCIKGMLMRKVQYSRLSPVMPIVTRVGTCFDDRRGETRLRVHLKYLGVL